MNVWRLPAIFILLAFAARGEFPSAPVDPLVTRIQAELSGPPTADAESRAGVPCGEMIGGQIADSPIYPGTVNRFQVYVPAQYRPDHPACLLVKLDGIGGGETVVMDNLIAEGAIPVMIVVGVVPGTASATAQEAAVRFNRSYEFDSLNENFPNYVLDELLPAVERLQTRDGRAIRLSRRAADRGATGASTGGIGSFTLAWLRPDSFSRVYSSIGTFVSMRGGDSYPALIRKFEPKPIRIFLEDGSTDSWNPIFGSWFAANQTMEAALSFAGYEVQHAWGVHGHNGAAGRVIFPDVMRWLWRDWPQPVKAGISQNDLLTAILKPGSEWQRVAGHGSIRALASDRRGTVCFYEGHERALVTLHPSGETILAQDVPELNGAAFGPDGTLYAAAGTGQVLAFDPARRLRILVSGIQAHGIVVTAGGDVIATEPGQHVDEPSTIWKIGPEGGKTALDRGISSAAGLAFSPDHALLFTAEGSTRWIYSFLANEAGRLSAKQRYYWLHLPDIPNDSGAAEIVVDRTGTLYAATRIGIQVCDRNGRVRAILPLPSPAGPVISLCWGGAQFDELYATDGRELYRRKLKIPGYCQWETPIALPPGGAG